MKLKCAKRIEHSAWHFCSLLFALCPSRYALCDDTHYSIIPLFHHSNYERSELSPLCHGVSLLIGCGIDKIADNREKDLSRHNCGWMGAIIKKGIPRFTGDAFNCLKKQVRQRTHWQQPDLLDLAQCQRSRAHLH